MIQEIIERLGSASTDADAFNQYALDGNINNRIRRSNLKNYLDIMLDISPKYMIVMEAPGYRGCRLTGVPVTSRRILLEGIRSLKLFGTEQGFQNVDDDGFENIYGEQSATIVWSTLANIQCIPLIWNTYPFHPHRRDQPRTNRRPRKSETRVGINFIAQLLTIFQCRTIIAVGNVAHETLSKNQLACEKVRHPAQGGKNDFVAGITKILKK